MINITNLRSGSSSSSELLEVCKSKELRIKQWIVTDVGRGHPQLLSEDDHICCMFAAKRFIGKVCDDSRGMGSLAPIRVVALRISSRPTPPSHSSKKLQRSPRLATASLIDRMIIRIPIKQFQFICGVSEGETV
jgi:hypothetical protein